MFPQLALIFLLKGLSPPKRSRVTQVSLGDFDSVSEGFPSSQDFAGQFPEPAYVFFSPFPSRSPVFNRGPESEWL